MTRPWECLLAKSTLHCPCIPQFSTALESLFFTENFDTKHGGVCCKMRVFCPKIWHVVLGSTQPRRLQVAFDIFSFGRADLCYSELYLKAISRAMKSDSKVKIGTIVHHTVLFLKRSRHLGYPDYVVCYSGSKSAWDANIGFQASVI